MRKITNTHRLWLLNVENSIDMRVPFDYVDITPKRVDILFDMGLIEYGNPSKGETTYVISEQGAVELKKIKALREKKYSESQSQGENDED